MALAIICSIQNDRALTVVVHVLASVVLAHPALAHVVLGVQARPAERFAVVLAVVAACVRADLAHLRRGDGGCQTASKY